MTTLIFGMIPSAVIALFILSSPWTGIAYTFDEKGIMHRTIWFAAGAAVLGLNLLIDAIMIWIFSHKLINIHLKIST